MQIITNVIGGQYQPYAFEALAVSSSAIPLTVATYDSASYNANIPLNQAQYVIITSETNSVRYRIDGQNPTTTVGHLMTAGSALVLVGYASITNFRVIAAAADATLMVTYER